MAIDFPPVLPPEQSDADALSRHVSTASAQTAINARLQDGRPVDITGNRHLEAAHVARIVSAADTPELAASALSLAYHDAGHLLVRVFYSKDGGRARIHVVNARLSGIDVPEPLRPYFSKLVGDTDLSAADFERRRLPAIVHSDRMGTDYSISYKTGTNPEDMTLVLTPKGDGDKARAITVGLNNQGNRFLGRYFGTLDYVQGFDHGGELTVSVNTLMETFGEKFGGSSYASAAIGYALARPHGLYSIQVGREEYTRSVLVNSTTNQPLTGIPQIDSMIAPPGSSMTRKVDLDATVDHFRIESEQLWYADRDTRLSTIVRLKHNDNQIEDEAGNEVIDESTTSLNIGAVYSTEIPPVDITTSLFADIGLAGNADASDDSSGIFDRGTGYTIWRPRANASWPVSEAHMLSFNVSGQLTDDEVTEHQQYVLGGPRRLAAWLPGVIIGDSGYHAVVSYTFSGLKLWDTELPIEIFVEGGGAEFEGDGVASGQKLELADAGVRISLHHASGFVSDIVAATPVSTSNLSDERLDFFDADFYWNISYTF